MAAPSSTSFHQEDTFSSGLQRHAISFQSDMIPIGGSYGVNSGPVNLMFCDNSSIIRSGSPTATTTGNSSGSLLLDSVHELTHEAGLAVDWTEGEQYKIEEGLVKFKDEPDVMKYIKIAATLQDKTVRDVALRCRWMMRKRRKQEDLNLGRKGNSRKDKSVESSAKANLPSFSRPNVAPYSFQQNQMDQSQRLNCQLLSDKAKQLLEQNLQVLDQIDNNTTCLKLQDNIDLFCRARATINNVSFILNDMREFSSKMSQMQDLPIPIDHNLANRILPRTNR